MDTNNTTARDVGAHTRLMVSLCNGTFTALNTEVAGVSLSEKACRMRTRLSICRKKAAYTQSMVDVRPSLESYARVSYARELRGDYPGAMPIGSEP